VDTAGALPPNGPSPVVLDRWPAGARCVVHLDLDCFYAAVEEVLDPGLCGKPVAVVMGLDQHDHGVVATASYAARAFGVHSAMALAAARRLCPDLIVLPVRHGLYQRYSAQVMALLRDLSPRLQQISIDEAFVELIGVPDALAHVQHLSVRVREEIGLSCSFGIATSKLVAKIATDQGKPSGFVVVPPGEEALFLADLAVEVLWGVGPRTASRLREVGIATLGALAQIDPSSLAPIFGHRRAMALHAAAQGVDDSPLQPERRLKSISSEQTLGSGEREPRRLWSLIRRMAADLAQRLQADGLVARTVGIKLRYPDWRLVTRDHSLARGIDDAGRIAAVAGDLMRAHWERGRPLRLLGLRVSGLGVRPAADQLPLFPLGAVNGRDPDHRP
jgi:DNA polymerase-4